MERSWPINYTHYCFTMCVKYTFEHNGQGIIDNKENKFISICIQSTLLLEFFKLSLCRLILTELDIF